MKHKSRNQKQLQYQEKYGDIPIDYTERLNWLYDKLNISEEQGYHILNMRDAMIRQLSYYQTEIILFEIPEGSPRPRFRLINRSNIGQMALANPNFVHVYSLTGKEDNLFMKRLINEGEFAELDQLIYTPCVISISAYMQTPSYYSANDMILAEIGMERPITKPDWDNIEKKYSDMFNKNVWLDDALVVDGEIHRFYSVLPRVEIRLQYLNMFYNRYQYNSTVNKATFEGDSDKLHYFKY